MWWQVEMPTSQHTAQAPGSHSGDVNVLGIAEVAQGGAEFVVLELDPGLQEGCEVHAYILADFGHASSHL